jgi:hypothetical protein
MNAKDFQLYLEQPQLLYALPLAELQGLAMEYPYSSNLRLLLLLKTHLEGHPDEQSYLQRCATASFDRAFIYDLLQDTQMLNKEEAQEETEILELRTLDEIALEDAALLSEDNNVAPENTLSYEKIFPELEADEQEEVLLQSAPVPEKPAKETVEPYQMPDAWAMVAAAFLSILPEWTAETAPLPDATKPEALAPEPVSRFSDGKRPEHGRSLKDRLRSIRRRQSEKLADEQLEVRKIARRSLVAKEAVASETLARLLGQQGQYQRAIKMYRSLELLYPEKKTIFAGLIKELQEKL